VLGGVDEIGRHVGRRGGRLVVLAQVEQGAGAAHERQVGDAPVVGVGQAGMRQRRVELGERGGEHLGRGLRRAEGDRVAPHLAERDAGAEVLTEVDVGEPGEALHLGHIGGRGGVHLELLQRLGGQLCACARLVQDAVDVRQVGVDQRRGALVDLLLRWRRGGVHELVAQQPGDEDEPVHELGPVPVLGEGEVGDRAVLERLGALGRVERPGVDDVGLLGVEQAAAGEGGQREDGGDSHGGHLRSRR